jgi:hypothetical protein
MKIGPGAVLAGAWAALRAPWWLEGDRLSTLLRPPADARADAAASTGAGVTADPHPSAEAPRGAVGAAVRTVALLSRLPRSPWRNTCLYRSAAECLVLRRYGVPALVRIGVRGDGEPDGGGILAHAWVVRAGEPALPEASPGGHTPLVLRA